MKGIVLAAGRGSRLNELTEVKPKPLLRLSGKTLFEWQLAAMHKAGIKDITVMTGYQGQAFTNFNVKCIHNPSWSSSNMVRTLMCADALLSDSTCIVSYGDIVYHPDIISKLLVSEGNIAISYDKDWLDLWALRFDNPLDDAETFSERGGVLVDIGRKTSQLPQISGQYMGLLKINPAGWAQIKHILDFEGQYVCDKLDMTALLLRLLEKKVLINTVGINGRWLEVDNQTDLKLYQKKIGDNQNWRHDWRW